MGIMAPTIGVPKSMGEPPMTPLFFHIFHFD